MMFQVDDSGDAVRIHYPKLRRQVIDIMMAHDPDLTDDDPLDYGDPPLTEEI